MFNLIKTRLTDMRKTMADTKPIVFSMNRDHTQWVPGTNMLQFAYMFKALGLPKMLTRYCVNMFMSFFSCFASTTGCPCSTSKTLLKSLLKFQLVSGIDRRGSTRACTT